MTNCSGCGKRLTLTNRDLASLRESLCSECAKRKARELKKPRLSESERRERRQAEISHRLRSEKEDRRRRDEEDVPSLSDPPVPSSRRLSRRPTAGVDSSLASVIHGKLTLFCLWVAQAVSILGCVGFLAWVPYTLYQSQQAKMLDALSGVEFAIQFGFTIVGFSYSYAMAIIFSKARSQRAKSGR